MTAEPTAVHVLSAPGPDADGAVSTAAAASASLMLLPSRLPLYDGDPRGSGAVAGGRASEARGNDGGVVVGTTAGAGAPAPDDLTASQKRGAVYLGVCFCLLFSAFQPAQAFVALLHPDAGYASLAVLYGTLAVSCLCAPSVIAVVGVGRALAGASLCYVLFVASLLSRGNALLLGASLLMGLGGAVLWVAQGILLRELATAAPAAVPPASPVAVVTAASASDGDDGVSPAHVAARVGQLNGLFFACYNGSVVLGYALSALVLATGAASAVVLFSLVGLGTVAVLLFWGLPCALGEAGATALQPLRAPARMTAGAHAWALLRAQATSTVQLLRRAHMLCLVPLVVWHGLNGSFVYSVLAALIGAATDDLHHVTYVFLVFGAVSIGTSKAWGWVLDRRGWTLVLWPCVVCAAASYSVMIALLESHVGTRVDADASDYDDETPRPGLLPVYYVISLVLGVTDAGAVVLTNATIVLVFVPRVSASAFACYRLVSAVAFCVGFGVRLGAGTTGTLAAALVSCVAAGLAFAVLHAVVLPVSPRCGAGVDDLPLGGGGGDGRVDDRGALLLAGSASPTSRASAPVAESPPPVPVATDAQPTVSDDDAIPLASHVPIAAAAEL